MAIAVAEIASTGAALGEDVSLECIAERWDWWARNANVAVRFWEQREYLRRAYESVYGPDPEAWPSRHPGVVLDAVPRAGRAGCLGCQWFGPGGYPALKAARRHETSEGVDP